MSEETTLMFRAHEQPITSCRFINGDTLVATASHNKTIGIWELSSGSQLHTLSGHDHRVVALSANKADSTLLSVSWDKDLIQWDLNSMEEMWRGSHESLLTSCHSIPKQALVVTGCDDGSYHYWDPRTSREVASHKAHANTMTCCRFSPNGCELCTCSMDGTTMIWDLRTHKQLLKLSGHVNVVSGCGFSPNGHYVATCSWDKTVRVYDVTSGSYRRDGPAVLTAHVGSASACAFSNNGQLLVSCGYDQDINIWSTHTFQLRNTFRGHEDWIQDIDIADSSKKIISGGKDGNVHIWYTDVSKSHHYRRKDNYTSMDLVTCTKCGRTFSPAGGDDSTGGSTQQPSISERLTHHTEQTHSKDEQGGCEVDKQLCVFCRLKDPSRTLEQRSGLYLNHTQHA